MRQQLQTTMCLQLQAMCLRLQAVRRSVGRLDRRGHDGLEAEVGVRPVEQPNVSAGSAKVDLYRVRAVQDDDPGLLYDEALWLTSVLTQGHRLASW